jgi:YegS/Rv2252/BmrU family lipid kinase
MYQTIAVVINASSGGANRDQKLLDLRAAFEKQNISPEFFLAHKGSNVTEVAQKAVANGFKLIAVSGGDGTINAVASVLVNSDTCLGVLPHGTFNHLAKDLHIPLELDQAIDVLINGQQKQIDTALVNNKLFLNNSSIGLYSRLVHFRDEQHRNGWSKKLALVRALFTMYSSYSFLNVEVEVEGVRQLYKTPLVLVGNNPYIVDGLDLGTRDVLDSGKLSLHIIKHSNRFDVIKLILHGLFKRLSSHPQFDIVQTESLTLHTRKQFLKVAIDGEVVTQSSPLKYKIQPKSLCVMVPKE